VTVNLDFVKFVGLLLASTEDDGRFDFENDFSCGKQNSDNIVACIDASSGVEFQFRREPRVDIVNIEITAGQVDEPHLGQVSWSPKIGQ